MSHIVNLAPHSNNHALADEPGTVAALGMGYTNIPVDWAEPAEDDYLRFQATMHKMDATGTRGLCHGYGNLRLHQLPFDETLVGLLSEYFGLSVVAA